MSDILEQFAWGESFEEDSSKTTVHLGEGFVTMRPHPEAYATVAQLRAAERPGLLMSGSCLAVVRNVDSPRFILIQRDARASLEPLKWQFPAGRTSPFEHPLSTGAREFFEEVEVLDKSAKPVVFEPMRLMAAPCLELRYKGSLVQSKLSHYILTENTLEAISCMFHDGRAPGLALRDREPYGRTVALLSRTQLHDLAAQGQLTAAAAQVYHYAAKRGWFGLKPCRPSHA